MTPQADKPFADALASLLSKEAARCRRSDDFAEMIEAIARGLGFTVAIAAKGDAQTIDTLLTGAEAYAHAEAVERAPLMALMMLGRRP